MGFDGGRESVLRALFCPCGPLLKGRVCHAEPLGREMDIHAARAATYRQRAEELRTVAVDTAAKIPRETLLKLADDYERLARMQDHMRGE